jgi:F-type H+-transporting ATPase subunit gamma
MASLRQIKRRMKSIDSIHEITKAMEMIAAFRYKRAEGRFSKSKNYFSEMEKLITNLAQGAENFSHGLFEPREVKNKVLVVLTGDKGLCGAYNTNIFRAANAWLGQNSLFHPRVVPIGKIGYEFFRKKHPSLILFGQPEKSAADFSLAKKIAQDLENEYLSKKVDQVELLYTTYRPGGNGVNRVTPFLSLNYLKPSGEGNHEVPDFIFEPDLNKVLSSLLSRYLEAKVYTAILESLTSEYSARMIAMKQASDNAEEVLDDLKLLRNKTRQSTITRELSEIVSGASILI